MTGGAPVAEFFVATPTAWSSRLADRVNGRFKLFKLGALYANEAAEELSGNSRLCTTVFDRTKADGVREFLADLVDSKRDHWRN